MKRIVLIYSILLVVAMSACNIKENSSTTIQSTLEFKEIEEDISNKKIDGVDYRDIIVSLCKKNLSMIIY